jgi:manganese efflux pump family protein
MGLINTLFIAVALAMDAFAVSVSGGASLKKVRINEVLLISSYFGFFQFLMTILGWQSGKFLSTYIQMFDHWIAFVLLFFIGAKMIWDSFKPGDERQFSFSHKLLLLLAICTSIDALGIGLSYAFLGYSILMAAIIIGIVAFGFSAIGVYLGKNLKNLLKGKATFAGGIILLVIALKILIDHGVF